MLEPGQSGSMTATITPPAYGPQVVRGTLYVDVFDNVFGVAGEASRCPTSIGSPVRPATTTIIGGHTWPAPAATHDADRRGGQRSRAREMTSRWMSEVPSSISSSLASRIHFSTGYSRE